MSARTISAAVVAAAAARLSYSALRARPPGGAAKWERTNHRGEQITLLEGPAVALGGVAGSLVAGGSGSKRLAVAIAGAGAAAFGGYDDLAGNGGKRGFRGHLGALRKGEVTTGAVKLAGIGATGLVAAMIAGRPGSDAEAHGSVGAVADVVINAGLIAGSANLLNLFDLRPGRATKVALLAGGLLAPSAGSAVAAPLAAAAALLPEDLGERSMLGDGGANALGAMLGAAAATSLPRPARIAALGVVVGLTVASEVVSFTQVIDRTPALHWADRLGRRPAASRAGNAVPEADAGPDAGTISEAGTFSEAGTVPDAGAPPQADATPAGAVRPAEAR